MEDTVLKCSSYSLLTASLPCIKFKGRNTKGQGCQDTQCFSFVLCSLGNFNFKNTANSSTVSLEFYTCDDATSQLSGLVPACLCNTCLYSRALFQGAAIASFHNLNPSSGLILNSFLFLAPQNQCIRGMPWILVSKCIQNLTCCAPQTPAAVSLPLGAVIP